MSKSENENRELLFDVQTPLPEVGLAHLSQAQRKVFETVARFVVGTTLAFVSFAEIMTDIQRYKNLGRIPHAERERESTGT